MEHRPEIVEFGVKWRAAKQALYVLGDLYRYSIEKHTIIDDKESLKDAVETLMDYIKTVECQVNMSLDDKSLSER